MLPVKKTILLKEVKSNMLVSSDLLGKGYFKVVFFDDDIVAFVPFTKLKDKEFKDLQEQFNFYEKHKVLQNRTSKKPFKVYGLHSSNVDKTAQQKVKDQIDEQPDEVKGLKVPEKHTEPEELKKVKMDINQFKEVVEEMLVAARKEIKTAVNELQVKGKSYNKVYVQLSVSDLVAKGGIAFLNKNKYEFCFSFDDKLVFLTEGAKK